MIGILTNISDIKSHQNDNGSTLSLCAAFIHHKTDQWEITIFGKYLETREENIFYVINHGYLGKYKYSRILESVMSQQLIDLMKILVLILLPEQLPVKNIECKFVTIDIKTTIKKIRCPDSK